MAIISEKYLAGLIDSDGGITFTKVKQGCKPGLILSIYQREDKASVLSDVQKTFGGTLVKRERTTERNPNPSLHWYVCASNAVALMQRLDKFLVIKRDYFRWAIEICSKQLESSTSEFNKQRKEKRNTRSSMEPNFPTRKWLAGYFDGDGTLSVSHVNADNTAILRFGITCHKNDCIGIDIIQKNFGGHRNETSVGKTCWQWTLYLSKSNCGAGMKFIDYFSRHCIIKQDQWLAVRQYLNSELKDGSLLDSKLRAAKAPPAETKSTNL